MRMRERERERMRIEEKESRLSPVSLQTSKNGVDRRFLLPSLTFDDVGRDGRGTHSLALSLSFVLSLSLSLSQRFLRSHILDDRQGRKQGRGRCRRRRKDRRRGKRPKASAWRRWFVSFLLLLFLPRPLSFNSRERSPSGITNTCSLHSCGFTSRNEASRRSAQKREKKSRASIEMPFLSLSLSLTN